MLLAKEDRPLHHRVHESRAERSWETPAFGAHQVDVRLAVDLRAAEEEDIDAPLTARSKSSREPSLKGLPFLLCSRETRSGAPLALSEFTCGSRDGRSRADGDVLGVADQASDHAGEELFSGMQTNSSR